MPTSVRRRLPLLAGCAFLVTGLMAGCAGKNDGVTAVPSVVTTLNNQAVSPTPAPTSAAVKTTAPAPATYPSQGKAYAEAILAAWKAKDNNRLGDLTTPQVQEQIMEIPGPPNMTWTFVMCDGAMGSQYCSFTNADGHKVTLRLQNEQLGKAHAGIGVQYS